MNLYKKIKYSTLLLLLFVLCYTIYNYNNVEEYLIYIEFKIIIILISAIVLVFFLPQKLKLQFKVIPLFALVMSLIILSININLSINSYRAKRANKIQVEYATKDCNLALEKFTKDKKNNSFKYFSYGFVYSSVLTENLEKYNVENFFQGCSINGNYNCYNNLVEKYLLEKYKINIKDLYK